MDADAASFETTPGPGGATILLLRGWLDAHSAGPLWQPAVAAAASESSELVVDASQLDYCDGAGAALIQALLASRRAAGGSVRVEGLSEEVQRLCAMVEPSEEREQAGVHRPSGLLARLGEGTVAVRSDMRRQLVFLGQMVVWLGRSLRHPGQIRGRDVGMIAERAGIGAVPIVLLVGLLLGLILAFQSAIPMQRFGAQIYVADLLGISVLRELGPLMAAILLTARSASAFAAEIGTMKVNEEVDALTTMGIEPVRFLVIPRLLAALIVVPVLILLTNFAALFGGAIVMGTLGFPLITFLNRVAAAASMGDLLGGLFKGFVFGMIVAAVGCQRGTETGAGAGAVGQSTTSAVVSGIILIAIVDGIFAVVFYFAGW